MYLYAVSQMYIKWESFTPPFNPPWLSSFLKQNLWKYKRFENCKNLFNSMHYKWHKINYLSMTCQRILGELLYGSLIWNFRWNIRLQLKFCTSHYIGPCSLLCTDQRQLFQTELIIYIYIFLLISFRCLFSHKKRM